MFRLFPGSDQVVFYEGRACSNVLRMGVVRRSRHCDCYRLRFKTPDALSLVSRTIWLDPCTIMSITPEIEYSLL